jgi:hypothetical protein
MDAQERRDSEVEQELDYLYQKVAGLDPQEDTQNGTAVRREGETPGSTDFQKPTEDHHGQKRRRRFAASRIIWGLAITLLLLGAIGFFNRPGSYTNRSLHLQGTATPLKADPLIEETRYPVGEKKSQPPFKTAIAVPSAEETKDQGVTTRLAEHSRDRAVAPPPSEDSKNPVLASPSGEKKREVPTARSVAPAPSKGRQNRYAIQLLAYAEDQKEDAKAHLEGLRKRTPDASMETVFIAERGVWHRILLGNFSTRQEAVDYQKRDRLAREYPGSFIQRKGESSQ